MILFNMNSQIFLLKIKLESLYIMFLCPVIDNKMLLISFYRYHHVYNIVSLISKCYSLIYHVVDITTLNWFYDISINL